ncbi:DegT/DnrJ/EryC1/StrS family aminotransferase [Candidatus Pacearchaeota archaeon]|nr:DegT/DnrJ/EryC1/StrS family aminotransferase [Candidatus Pacearchaeota archaeon]
MQNKILGYAKKVPELLKLLVLPYQFGFVQGHSHLTNQQVLQIRQVLHSSDNQNIVNDYEQRMSALIGDGYGISFAAGRMAFYSLLKILGIGEGDEVILPGFTCSVMPNAIWRTGATPIFADIDSETFGSDAEGIKNKITPRTKMIVAQHSFGIPCNIVEIVELCDTHGIFLMEDCAITLESSIFGVKVGNWGDAAIFSTDHSKPLNTIIGGFLYTKNQSLYDKVRNFSDKLPQLDQKHQKRLYNQFKFERKYNIPSRYPRAIFMDNVRAALRKVSCKLRPDTFLEGDYRKEVSSNSSYPYPAKLPPFLAQLGLFELDVWENKKNRRKKLFDMYLSSMTQLYCDKYLPQAYFNSDIDVVPLRFVFQHPESERIMKKMSQFIDVNGTWFREPIICCSDGPESIGYLTGSCQMAEKTGHNIINWPCVVPKNWESRIIEIFQMVMKGCG